MFSAFSLKYELRDFVYLVYYTSIDQCNEIYVQMIIKTIKLCCSMFFGKKLALKVTYFFYYTNHSFI